MISLHHEHLLLPPSLCTRVHLTREAVPPIHESTSNALFSTSMQVRLSGWPFKGKTAQSSNQKLNMSSAVSSASSFSGVIFQKMSRQRKTTGPGHGNEESEGGFNTLAFRSSICKQEPSGNLPTRRPHSVGADGTGGPCRSVAKSKMIGMTSEGSFPANCADMVKLLLKALAVGLKVFKHKALRKHTCPSKAQVMHCFRPPHGRLMIWNRFWCLLRVQYLGV